MKALDLIPWLAATVIVAPLPLCAEDAPAPIASEEAPHVPDDLVVKDSVVHQIGDKTLTIILGDASKLPDPDLITPAEPPAPTPEQLAECEARRAQAAQIRFITVGATVYNHAETSFRWHDIRTGKFYEAWSNIDFNHLTSLPAADSARLPFLRFLQVTNIDTAAESARLHRAVQVPAHPQLPLDHAGFVVTSQDQPEAGALEPVQELHEFYELEKERLAAEYAAREQERLAKLAAPATPAQKDNVIWFRPRKGSRYLENQQANAEGGAE